MLIDAIQDFYTKVAGRFHDHAVSEEYPRAIRENLSGNPGSASSSYFPSESPADKYIRLSRPRGGLALFPCLLFPAYPSSMPLLPQQKIFSVSFHSRRYMHLAWAIIL